MNLKHSISLLLMGNSNENKDILSKKTTKEDHIRTIECWIARHYLVLMNLKHSISLLLMGNSNENKDILSKKTTKEDHIRTIKCWIARRIARHYLVLYFIIIVLMFIAFIFVCYALVGITAVESGGMRNFANRGII